MTGAGLASVLKCQPNSNMKFDGISGVKDETLHLTEDNIKVVAQR